MRTLSSRHMCCFDHWLDSPHELFRGHKVLDDALERRVNVGQSHAIGMRVAMAMALPTMNIVISVGDACVDGAPASAGSRPFAMHSWCWY